MQHITDNFIFRKIRRLRKTESGRTIKSFENDEIEYFQYESEPVVRACGSATATADAPFAQKSAKIDDNFDGSYERFFADLLRGHTENKHSSANRLSVTAENFIDHRRDSLVQNSIHSASSRRTTTSAEFSESVFNAPTPSVEVDTEPANRLLHTPSNETSTALLVPASEQNANSELAKMFEEYEDKPTKSKDAQRKNKTDSKKDVHEENVKSESVVDTTKTLSLPRKLTLPDKVTYKGERINMQISGPVHILTANIHHHHYHHHGPKKDDTDGSLSLDIEPSKNAKVSGPLKYSRDGVSPLEKYVESLCDFTAAFDELGRQMVGRTKAASHADDAPTMHRIAPAKKTTSFTYRVSGPHVKASIERPASAPYLVQTNSYCHLARVIEITQEWRLECNAQAGTASRTLYDGLRWLDSEQLTSTQANNIKNDKDESSTSCFEDTKFDTLKKQVSKMNDNTTNLQLERNNFIKTRSIENLDNGGKLNTIKLDKFDLYKNEKSSITPIVVVEPPQPPPRFLHKTQSALEMPASYIRKYNTEISSSQFNSLRRTIENIEENLESARLYTKESRNREARRIERAILDISERLSGQRVPLTRAQAEANEELLRTRLAEMILDIRDDPSKSGTSVNESVYDYGVLREPLNILRNKLSFLEQFVEEEDSIKEELSTIVQLPRASRHSNIIQKRERALKRRGEEIARMTPLISEVKQKLGSLEDVVDRGRPSGRATPYHERKTVHDLLTGINAEINTIHALCRENSGSGSETNNLNTVVDVLSRMCVSLDAILDAMKYYTAKTNNHSDKITTNKAVKNNANGVYYKVDIVKEEENESVLSFIIHFGNGIRLITPRIDLKTTIRKGNDRNQNRRHKEEFQGQSQLSSSIDKNVLERQQQIKRTSSRKKSSLAIPEPMHSPRKKIHLSAFPRDVSCALNVSLLRRDQVLEVARTFHVIPIADITFSIIAAPPIIYESDEMTTRPKTRSASWRGGHAADIGESSDFGDASSFIFDENEEQNVNVPSSEPLDFFQNLCESPRAAKYSRRSRHVDETESVSLQSKITNVSALVPESLLNDDESLSEAMTLSVPILFRRSERETAILTDEDAESNFVYVYNMRSSCTETFDLRRRNKRAILNAIVYPETRAEIIVNVATDTFEVEVERVNESDRQSVVMVMISEEYYSKKVKITRKLNPIDELMQQLRGGEEDDNSSYHSREPISDEDNNDNNENSLYVETLAKLNVSIMARSVRDSVLAHLEEIPWGEVAICLPTDQSSAVVGDVMTTSNISQQTTATSGMARDTASVVSNIVVNENCDEIRSLAPSHRSGGSMRSLATMSLADIDIPAYVIKQGSTASITCEMNAYVQRRDPIEWYRGREPIDLTDKRYDRISHDLIEVLVILRVDADAGQLYSIKVHGEIYPVAYLIIEECETPKPPETVPATTVLDSPAAVAKLQHAFFISPPQTMFVMQGQTAIISCQMSVADLNVVWYRESERIHDGADDRIFFERTPTAWYRIIIEDVDFVDQGVYYAFYHERSTTINLIVEERIDEREVQVSSAETDDDELSDYLVPIGSTATIACELDSSTALAAVSAGSPHRLRWQRDNVDIPTAEMGTSDAPTRRFEHVQNENKHYLIVHNAQPADSGVYSVLVNGVRFKVAQITIGQHGLLLRKSSQQSVSAAGTNGGTPRTSRRRSSTSRIKRISNT